MNYEGKIYRPWPEGNSLLIQTTIGCTYNKCTFCDMFREKKFSLRKLEDIFNDIEKARMMYHHVQSIFLIDGNVMAVKTDFILKVIEKIRNTFPECMKISLYSSYVDFKRKSIEDLKKLKDAGLNMAYVGLESGDPLTLKKIEKGMTPDEAIEGAAKAKEAGIDVLASFIFGIGGKKRSKEHIIKTVELLNILKPEEIAPMALAIQPGTKLEAQIHSGEFVQASPKQILEEEKYLMENLNINTFYWGDHGNNIVSLKGWLPDSRELFLKQIEHAIAVNPVTKQEVLNTFAW